MAQQTNLNVAPYFDDFNPSDNYHRVLFKPGYAVQARELTTLQSILQNQIERFGQHLFKEGAKVIPGNTSYNQLYYAVQVQNLYLGVPVDAYVNQLVGATITGQTSGVTAFVDKVITSSESIRSATTLYVSYISSSTTNNSSQTFFDNEALTCNRDIFSGLLGNTTIPAGTPFASTLTSSATATGSSFSIREGIYFIRGQFVNVDRETLILDQYNNKPNYRIGLNVNEQIINSDIDETLTDNSQGYNNYSAPGADRLKITVSLFKKSLDDFNDNNFIELATVQNGTLKTLVQGTQYSEFANELAKRTYEESGDYYVNPFKVDIKESLNNRMGNDGIYNSGQFTASGSIPSDNLAICRISPGKAYVRGYEIKTISSTFLELQKPRTTKTLENQSINYKTGPTLRLNRSNGFPVIGIGNTYVLSLRDSRIGATSFTAAGKEIGVARVYDYRLESGSYNNSSNLNEWYISLYDIQTTTEIAINEPTSLSVPTFIKGKNSGATAFIKDAVIAGTAVTVYETKGNFVPNEQLIIDGIETGLVSIAVTSYGISDVKSVYGIVGSGSTFNADTVQSTGVVLGEASITAADAGISTVTISSIVDLTKVFKPGNLISYSNSSVTSDPIYSKVTQVNTSSLKIQAVTAVSGINSGALPTSAITTNNLSILNTNLADSKDNTLYTLLPKSNISNVDLVDGYLNIRKTYTVDIASNQLSTNVVVGTNETFLPFDEERYSLVRSNGQIEVLTSDRFAFINGGKELQIYNLGSNDTNAKLITTLRKLNPKAKIKRKNRINSIVVNKSKYSGSGIGGTTLNDGLIFGKYPYGTRVQDETISLNVPDVITVLAIYESTGTGDSSAPTMILSDINGPTLTTSDLLVGEKIVGSTSGAIAVVAEKNSATQISYINKNSNLFKQGETVTFEESGIQAIISTLNSTSFNISTNYTFTTNQKSSFYDYSFITRRSEFLEPTKKLKIYFENAYYDSTDDGDITTVNSYNLFNYTEEIGEVDGIGNSDIIDIRPRTSNYSVSENSRSPLEFYGRIFSQSGNSSANILASDESILINYSFYLGRVDRVFLTKDGIFQIRYGEPSEKPEQPSPIDDALEIATITLPPYLYNVRQTNIRFLNHKRYRMSDIKKIEDRVKNLEYYTTLSLLETNTANLFIPDENGLNRFKSGFLVDNFTTSLIQESKFGIKNSTDIKNRELRPQHYTNSIDLSLGPVVNVNPNADKKFSTIEGINVRRSEDVITLDYSEVEWLAQTFATRTESVTPFMISFWSGTVTLTPSSDTWVDTARIDANIIDVEGNYQETLLAAQETYDLDPQTGFAPTIWDSWQTDWSSTSTSTSSASFTWVSTTTPTWQGSSGGGLIPIYGTVTRSQIQTTNVFATTTTTSEESRTGTTHYITESLEQVSLGDGVVSTEIISFMRSRNIEFVSKRVKPNTQLYAFFDGVDVTSYCIPKLLEISMVSGVFQVGETVVGSMPEIGINENLGQTTPSITFRVAQSNHMEGPYDAPTVTFPENPYTNQVISSNYSSTSNILNVDTYSLADQPEGQFSGWVSSGMTLVGQTSGAQATITNLRLVSDLSATLIGNLYVPDPNIDVHPRFETGTKVFTLVNSNINDQNAATTIAESSFTSSGTLETIQEDVLSIRNATIDSRQEFDTRTTTSSSTTVSTSAAETGLWRNAEVIVGYYDPLAQSFFVDDAEGVFLTKCQVYFETKDDENTSVTVQIRTMSNGYPTTTILPFSEVDLSPSQVNTSSDGSVATTIQFKAPVYLEGGKEYALALVSSSTKYQVFISRVGENDLLTQAYISNQPYLGSLFKSQNASTWEPSQWDDLKFKLYRAEFLTSGTVEFYNPELSEGNGQIAKLMPDSFSMSSKKIRVGLGTTVQDAGLTVGNTVYQANSNATGDYVGSAGIATGSLRVISAGIGYTPSAGIQTFTGVNLVTISGSGRNAIANVTVNAGSISSASITSGGVGYVVGDVLGITTIGSFNVGSGARLSLSSISATNEIILDNVQGDFVTGAGGTIYYTNSVGVNTILNYSVGGGVIINAPIVTVSDGLHVKVNHKNHGMYSDENYVIISDVMPDLKPTTLTSEYTSDSTSPISVSNASSFSTFENVGVGTTNSGYVLIGNEVITYTSSTSNTIGGSIVRGSNPKTYPIGTPVYKYELNGVSLRRINKTHNLDDVTISDPITFDSYNIRLDMSSDGVDRTVGTSIPKLYPNRTKTTGGYSIKATQNMPYEIITPIVQNLTLRETTLSATMRTVTGKSLSGTESPFIDNGVESIALNQANYLDSPRIICSKVNETQKLQNLNGNKSFNMSLRLETSNSKLSPVIDAQRVYLMTTSNRVNDVITNYATDGRVNSVFDDPTACQYISKEMVLENSATSIKVLAASHINNYNDIRVFYSISENPNFDPIFIPFPGYNNLDSNNQIINPSDNDGRPNRRIEKSNVIEFSSSKLDYVDYEFTVDNLPAFRACRIKIVLSSTSQVYVPRLRDLRIITLA